MGGVYLPISVDGRIKNGPAGGDRALCLQAKRGRKARRRGAWYKIKHDFQGIAENILRLLTPLLTVVLTTPLPGGTPKPQPKPQPPQPTSEHIIAGTTDRIDAVFRAESGKPLRRAKKRKPLGPGRGNYVRGYSYSIVAFAARCLYLGEMLDEANAAIAENARHYLENPKDILDRDSFHWHADIVLRLIELYGTDGSRHAGRITPATEALALKPVWIYVKKVSKIAHADVGKTGTWHIRQSENHHAMSFTVCWHFAKIAREREAYARRTYADGGTAAAHYRAWNDYVVAYCRERARKGLFVEMMCSGYNSSLIKGIYNFYDFGEPRVRRAAGMLLDLYFAYWAQEQIDGVQGGGRSRIYFHKAMRPNRRHGTAPLAWFYFAVGERPGLNGHDVNGALSDYRPPAVVADIARDVAGRGRYAVRQRPLGLAAGHARITKTAYGGAPYIMKTDAGGILRYSYCDPAFIIGSVMTKARPLDDWTAISAQNRWQGAIFAGDSGARIVPIVRPKDNRVAMNAQWSVQQKGCLITQKLRGHKGGAEMIVWLSTAGLAAPVVEDGVVFTRAAGAYAAVRPATGGFRWMEGNPFGFNRYIAASPTMILDDEYAPVILEVMAAGDVKDFAAFKARVKARAPAMDGTVLRYVTVYGDRLTLDTAGRGVPTINGRPVDYAPPKAFASPFLSGDWNGGVVTITKGRRKKVLDFNAPAR